MPDTDQRAIARQVRDLAAGIQADLDGSLRRLGLTAAQYGVLRRVQEAPGRSSAELARNARVSAQSMHEIISALARRGLLERTSARGRVLSITLTDEGSRLVRRGRTQADRVSARLVAGLTPAEQRRLAGLLTRMEDGLRSSS